MRFPILLYRLRLGWLLGKRFLLLEHRGRKSGILRRAVIEVVDHNPRDGTFVVVAAWGRKSDWYRNVSADPRVDVAVASKRFAAIARSLSREEAACHLLAYSTNHPTAFRKLGSLLIGEASRDSAEIIRSFAESVPLVEFSPIQSPQGAREVEPPNNFLQRTRPGRGFRSIIDCRAAELAAVGQTRNLGRTEDFGGGVDDNES